MKVKGITAAAIAGLALAGCSSESSPELPPGKVDVSESQEIAGQLVFLDTNQPVIDEVQLRKYERALDRADPLCDEGRTELGKTAFGASETAKGDGFDLSSLNMLEVLPKAVPAKIAPTDCQFIFAAELTLLGQGEKSFLQPDGG